MAINIADCSLGDPVLNLLHMGENQNIQFLVVFEQFIMSSKEKLKADTHTADVEKGFSAQKLICTSQRIRLTENQDMLLRVQMEAPREVKVS